MGVDGYVRIYIANGGNAVAWSEVLILKNKMEAAWRSYLKTGD